MKLLIKNGRLLDPAAGTDAIRNVLIEDDRIANPNAAEDTEADRVIDASGCWVTPGLIDLHVHLREPGFEYKETIETGSRAAAHGGYTTICPMPNTKPAIDSGEMIDYIRAKAVSDACIHVLPVGAVTVGQKGETVAAIEEMAGEGAAAISEDGKSVMNADLYRDAMRLAAKCHLPVFAHCEDINLVHGGCINEGEASRRLGLPGISNSVEDVITARDMILAKETGAQLHLCHCSTKDSVEMIRLGKKLGVNVTAEVCPHHFAMSDADITSADSNFKMNPPLRSPEDVEALKQGLKDGTMDVISTDHAPHHADEKARPITEAPFGIVGSETAVPLTITHLVEPGYLTPLQMVEKMSWRPAQILHIDKGTIQKGKIADVAIISPDTEYVIDGNAFASKGKNTPFIGKSVRGKVLMTICDGKIVYDANSTGGER